MNEKQVQMFYYHFVYLESANFLGTIKVCGESFNDAYNFIVSRNPKWIILNGFLIGKA